MFYFLFLVTLYSVSLSLQSRTNKDLVYHLKSQGYISAENAIKAMVETDRGHYCKDSPYQDSPQSIGYGVTISAPHMHASALQHLSSRLKPGSRALDVGHGTGYVAACMARMVGILEGKGKVIGIEIIKDLVPISIANVRKDDRAIMESPNFKLMEGDGWKGVPDEGPYDAIHVGAAASEIPQSLIDQLAPRGLLFIPIGPETGRKHIHLVEKTEEGKIKDEQLFGVQYVPLVKQTSRHTH